MAETSFDHLIRWYPQVTLNGRDGYGLDIIGRLENSKVTEKARDLLFDICNNFRGKKGQLKLTLKKAVHYEHNCPVEVIKRKLISLENSRIDEIKATLNDGYEIILISKDEEALLRKKGLTKTAGYHERLESIGNKIID